MAAEDELAAVHPLHQSNDEALRTVALRVDAAIDAIVPSMGDAYRREVAEYAAMDDKAFADVLRTSAAFVRRFALALADGIENPVPSHMELAAAGRHRQEVGVSLDAAMHAFRIASRFGWTLIADASTATAPRLVSELAGRWIEYADRASTAFAEGHTSATSEQLRRLDARRQALVADLLAAADESAARAVATSHGVRLEDAYAPVIIATTLPAEVDRVEARLPAGTIAGRRGEHVVALIPETAVGVDVAMDIFRGLHGTAAVAHGEVASLGSALLAEVAKVESVLGAASRLGRHAVLGPDDLPLYRALQEHLGLRQAMRGNVLEPLVAADPDGIFRATLRAFLEDGTVRSVADAMFVHANTVTYRLRRVRESTGLDARIPAQAAHLVLALALEDLDQTTTRTAPQETER